MALQKSNATQLAVKEEVTFNTAVTFSQDDVIPFCEASFSPTTEVLERCATNSSSLLPYAALKGRQTTSGNIAMEALPAASDPELVGHVLYETALGAYDDAGAVIDVTNHTIVDHTAASDGTDGLYYLGDGSDAVRSLGIKYILGGAAANSVDIRGNVIESMNMSFPPQGIIKTTFNIQGSTGFIPVTSGALSDFCTTIEPYVAKSCTLTVDGTALVATDVEFTVTNAIADFVSVNSDGVEEKTFTGRKIEGSFKLIFDDLSQINTFNSWADAQLFIHVVQHDNKELAIELLRMKRTSLDIAPDDGGIITQTVKFEAYDSCAAGTDSAFKLAIKA
jgi:hypothetical protein